MIDINSISAKSIKRMRWLAVVITLLPALAYIGLGIDIFVFNLANSGMTVGQLIGPFLAQALVLLILAVLPVFLRLIGGILIVAGYCCFVLAILLPTLVSPYNRYLMFADPIWILYAFLVSMPLIGAVLFIVIGKWERQQREIAEASSIDEAVDWDYVSQIDSELEDRRKELQSGVRHRQ